MIAISRFSGIKWLMLFPNGEMPLTALLSKLSAQGTDDAEFNW